ncbi:MAG: acetyl-CoA carboxylase carboxyltransferase subunit beta [Spirochaetes bacterium]|nr:acetyl-CoA carboxylase carboxyltransferase subunit beta [Spirochaetota bacterium]
MKKWYERTDEKRIPEKSKAKKMPEGLWSKCPSCGKVIYQEQLIDNQYTCMECDHHFRIGAKERIEITFDDKSFKEMDTRITSLNPLEFTDNITSYDKRLSQAMKKTNLTEAVVTGTGKIYGIHVACAILDFNFFGGSMGSVVGEKITRVVEKAIKNKIPLVIISMSGGARMQEGIFSLMQMAKTSAALALLSEKRVPYISILADPTTGGVSASFSMLGDINIAEPKALIGFAGPRVIEQTIKQKLPPGFQRSEFLLEHGMVDIVVHRKALKATVAQLLRYMT